MTAHHLPLRPLLDYIETHCPHDEEHWRERDGRMELTDVRVAECTGLGWRVLFRYRQSGIVSLSVADRIATHLGQHPSLIWPEYNHLPIEPLDCVPRRCRRDAVRLIKRGHPFEHLLDAPVRRPS